MYEREFPGPINHPKYGLVMLRAFDNQLGWLRSHCIADIANQTSPTIAPRHFELLDLGLDEGKWRQRLEEAGFTPPFRVLKGLTQYIGVIEYCGAPLPDRITAAWWRQGWSKSWGQDAACTWPSAISSGRGTSSVVTAPRRSG